jgi:hypothetical protein
MAQLRAQAAIEGRERLARAAADPDGYDAKIVRMVGPDGPDDTEWIEWQAGHHLREEAARTARWCGRCGRDIAPGEVVARRLFVRGGTNVTCADCSRYYVDRYKPEPCVTCGRPVINTHQRWATSPEPRPGFRHAWREGRYYGPARVWCCEDCAVAASLARRRRLRAEARAGQKCEGCGEMIDAGRNDARYCSNACRQRAYRQRADKSHG